MANARLSGLDPVLSLFGRRPCHSRTPNHPYDMQRINGGRLAAPPLTGCPCSRPAGCHLSTLEPRRELSRLRMISARHMRRQLDVRTRGRLSLTAPAQLLRRQRPCLRSRLQIPGDAHHEHADSATDQTRCPRRRPLRLGVVGMITVHHSQSHGSTSLDGSPRLDTFSGRSKSNIRTTWQHAIWRIFHFDMRNRLARFERDVGELSGAVVRLQRQANAVVHMTSGTEKTTIAGCVAL